MLLRARKVLTVGAQLVIQETNSYGRTRCARRGKEGEKASVTDTIAETTPGNFVRKEASKAIRTGTEMAYQELKLYCTQLPARR